MEIRRGARCLSPDGAGRPAAADTGVAVVAGAAVADAAGMAAAASAAAAEAADAIAVAAVAAAAAAAAAVGIGLVTAAGAGCPFNIAGPALAAGADRATARAAAAAAATAALGAAPVAAVGPPLLASLWFASRPWIARTARSKTGSSPPMPDKRSADAIDSQLSALSSSLPTDAEKGAGNVWPGVWTLPARLRLLCLMRCHRCQP
eukprot:364798-Chlamydomonas_euryale.AAC.23